jgi:glucose-1-phosphate cytidylyltransferase
MKVAILAGGFGTRLTEETTIRPKPMVEIGGRPILWHIMKYYAHFGFRDFVILGGYKVDYIRDYFMRYRTTNCDFTVDLQNGQIEWSDAVAEDWRVTVLDTGINSMTGGQAPSGRRYLLPHLRRWPVQRGSERAYAGAPQFGRVVHPDSSGPAGPFRRP